MSMWNGKTDLWGRKTRPSVMKEALKAHANGNAVEQNEEYLEVEDKIKALEAKLIFYKSMVDEKCKEICALNKRLEDNTNFMQTVVLELIQMKNYKPTPATAVEVKPAGALEKYIAKKNSEASVKLP